jgi:(1->4)-alpha-D-glucan 1-alpha-D-glucosylmutase
MPAAAYVAYPFDDLLGILALESQRNRCLVVGEDLGTVPDTVRETLHPLGVLSTRCSILNAKEDGRLTPPQLIRWRGDRGDQPRSADAGGFLAGAGY